MTVIPFGFALQKIKYGEFIADTSTVEGSMEYVCLTVRYRSSVDHEVVNVIFVSAPAAIPLSYCRFKCIELSYSSVQYSTPFCIDEYLSRDLFVSQP